MGTIFRIGGSGGLTTLHSFGGSDGSAPIGALVQARDGDLYGATARGGVNGYGSVFRIDPSGNLVTLHSFDGSDGGNQPSGGLLLTSDGNFYGTTALGGTGGSGNYGNGTAFRMDPSGVVTVLHSFGDNDAHPVGPLIQARDGRFYGTALGQTTLAHLFGIGSIYQMDSSGNLTALHEFAEGEGEGPYAALLQGSDGNLYGATMLGGVNGSGTLYRATTTGTLATLYTFPLLDEGVGPQAGLLAARDGSLYGTTSDGGTGANGTVFRLGPDGVPVTLHSFGSSEGNTPYASLIQGTDGNFYGTTLGGGAQDQGTVFRMDSSGALTTLHSFGDSPGDGRYPYAALLQARDGNFYGTTPLGGTYGEGAVFRMDASGEATILHSFTPFDYQVDGGFPYAALIQAADGYLYGTTSAGGANFGGTIFRIDSNGTFTTLHSFERQEGAEPSQLMQGRDGYFYGTTSSSSFEPIGKGTVFRMDSSGKVTTLHDFSESEGGNGAPLLQASDGAFYGMTKEGSPPDYGTIFRIDTGGNFATLHRFAFSGGVYPAGALVEKSEGVLYGATSGGGPSRGGVIFRIVERADVLPVNRPRRPVRTVPPRD